MSSMREKAVADCVAALDTRFFKALCEPARVAVFRELIILGSSDIAGLSERLPQDRSVISRHLKILADAGIVVPNRTGRHILYSVNLDTIEARLGEMLQFTRALGQGAEIQNTDS